MNLLISTLLLLEMKDITFTFIILINVTRDNIINSKSCTNITKLIDNTLRIINYI